MHCAIRCCWRPGSENRASSAGELGIEIAVVQPAYGSGSDRADAAESASGRYWRDAAALGSDAWAGGSLVCGGAVSTSRSTTSASSRKTS